MKPAMPEFQADSAPVEALERLLEIASKTTSEGETVRGFLFWLEGLPEPTAYRGDIPSELRGLNSGIRLDATRVFSWWIGPSSTDDPLHWTIARLYTCLQCATRDKPGPGRPPRVSIV